MHQRISKKIFIYFFVFLTLVTINNIKFLKYKFLKINNYQIHGLSVSEHKQLQKNIKELENNNIFTIDKKKITEVINSNKLIENFFVFKNYPSSLKIDIERTNFIAITKKNGINYYLGTNGNLIKANEPRVDLPFLFGNINIKEFLKIKKIIDNSDFNFSKIKNLHYFKSKRWNLETKDGIIVKLPVNKLEPSLHLLSKIFNNNEFKVIKSIDLRQNNQVIINGQ